MFTADRNHVESARPDRIFWVTLKKPAGGADDSPLLGPGDAVCTAAVPVVFTVPYFSEYQRVAVQHGQVNFTKTSLVVSLQCFEPALI